MARASIRTWLSLDRWAQIVGGISPLHFNQLYLQSMPTCGSVWFQWEWQASDQVSREEIAQSIQIAELMISGEVGYNLMPDWISNEEGSPPRFMSPELPYLPTYTAAGRPKTLEVQKAYYIQGGRRAVTAITLNVAVTTHDLDSDGWSETCRSSVVTTVDPTEIGVFFPGHLGETEYEIRPTKVTGTSPNYTIEFKRWLMVKQAPLERISPAPLDATVATNFETVVDVYRVWTDPSHQAELIYSADSMGTFDISDGALEGIDPRLGVVSYVPGTWDPTTSAFLSNCSESRDPDRLKLNYLSGYRLNGLWKLDPFWERAITYFSLAFLSRPVCDCSNVSDFVDHWVEDLGEIIPQQKSFQLPYEMVKNPFGTKRGAIFAWNCCHQNGRKITR